MRTLSKLTPKCLRSWNWFEGFQRAHGVKFYSSFFEFFLKVRESTKLWGNLNFISTGSWEKKVLIFFLTEYIYMFA